MLLTRATELMWSAAATGDDFAADLTAHLKKVQSHYGMLFNDAPALSAEAGMDGLDGGNLVFTGTDPDPDTLETIRKMGFAGPAIADFLIAAIGYKSINDPLYRSEKLMVRAAPLLKNPDDIDAYLEAVNLWGQKIQMSSLNAYTSAWGEANPNGSKAQVAAYMQEAKFDVEESADLLKRILVMLGLPLTALPELRVSAGG